MVALFCLGGVGIALIVFRQTTEPDRSTPDVVVFQYVRALLVDRNEIRARELTCDGSLGTAEILGLRDEIDARQKELGVEIATTVVNVVNDIHGSDAHVSVDLRRSAMVDGRSQVLNDPWRFVLLDTKGWRVCGSAPNR
jgi:hypothetical protein